MRRGGCRSIRRRRFRDHAGYSEQTERRIRISDHSRSCKSRDPGRRGAKISGAVSYTHREDGALIKTIVTSNLAEASAKGYGVDLIEVLTGFKFIGQQILGFENSGKGTYLFGFEESYGCLIGTYARDKDAIVATMALCEAAAYYKTQGKTLWDAMIEMYDQYGYYKDDIKSITLKGIEGLHKIQELSLIHI